MKRQKYLLISVFAVVAAGLMLWIHHASLALVSVEVEPGNLPVYIIPVPDDAREETARRFFAECRGEAASRSFFRYVYRTLEYERGSEIQCPVKAGHFSVRLKPGLYVFEVINGKGFEDLRLVNVDGDKALDFSQSVFMLSKTRLY